jgi:hypothetical protein
MCGRIIGPVSSWPIVAETNQAKAQSMSRLLGVGLDQPVRLLHCRVRLGGEVRATKRTVPNAGAAISS